MSPRGRRRSVVALVIAAITFPAFFVFATVGYFFDDLQLLVIGGVGMVLAALLGVAVMVLEICVQQFEIEIARLSGDGR